MTSSENVSLHEAGSHLGTCVACVAGPNAQGRYFAIAPGVATLVGDLLVRHTSDKTCTVYLQAGGTLDVLTSSDSRGRAVRWSLRAVPPVPPGFGARPVGVPPEETQEGPGVPTPNPS